MTTGLRLVIVSVVYMIMMFIVFSFLPSSTFYISGGSIANINATSINATAGYDNSQNVDIFDVFKGLYSFGLAGADVPWWLSIIAVYLPIFILVLGVYAIIRGLS